MGSVRPVANDPSTIYWNPAGLAGLLRKEVTFSHTIRVGPPERQLHYMAAVLPAEDGDRWDSVRALRTDMAGHSVWLNVTSLRRRPASPAGFQ